jgi:hypothetical protein
MKIPDKALDNIRTMSKNLLDNLDSVTEENKPSYAGPGSRISIEYPLDELINV